MLQPQASSPYLSQQAAVPIPTCRVSSSASWLLGWLGRGGGGLGVWGGVCCHIRDAEHPVCLRWCGHRRCLCVQTHSLARLQLGLGFLACISCVEGAGWELLPFGFSSQRGWLEEGRAEWLCCHQCLKNDDVNMAPAVGLWSPWGPEDRNCPDLPSTLCSANRRPSLHLSLQKLNNFLRQRRGV